MRRCPAQNTLPDMALARSSGLIAIVQASSSSPSKLRMVFRYLCTVTSGPYHLMFVSQLWRLRLLIPRPSIPGPVTRSRRSCNFFVPAPRRRSGSACTTIRPEARGGLPARPSSICETANGQPRLWSRPRGYWINCAAPPIISTNSPAGCCNRPLTWSR